MADSKTLPARGEQTELNSTHGRGNLYCSVDSASFSLSLGSATLNEANKSLMLCAEWTITARQAVLLFA